MGSHSISQPAAEILYSTNGVFASEIQRSGSNQINGYAHTINPAVTDVGKEQQEAVNALSKRKTSEPIKHAMIT